MERLLLDVMCGYDAAYALDLDVAENPGTAGADVPDDALLAVAREEERRIVTRDRQLVEPAEESVLIESRDVADQLAELVAVGFELSVDDEPTYCGACNGPLRPVGPDERTPEYAPDPESTNVWRCEHCGQHSWKGSHWADVAERIENLYLSSCSARVSCRVALRFRSPARRIPRRSPRSSRRRRSRPPQPGLPPPSR